ncbi:MAG: peptidoglycan DD-metalloendopeptidase family protein [Rhodoglobus sp.]|nr:peptidoglycan DD-metalloendopeptidase family protein [Rhodoglobus sp.]
MRNFFTGYPVTGTWAEHIARGSAGGIDRGMPVGTPLYACADAYFSPIRYNGTGGHTANLAHNVESSTQYMHLSRFNGGARYVGEGELVGWSGGMPGSDGAGSSDGPHLHAHSYFRGVRIPPLYEGGAAGTPGIGMDMALTESDIHAIWTYVLGQANPPAGQPPVRGRAADWLTNMSDSIGRTENAVKRLGSPTLSDAQLKTLADAIAAKVPAVSLTPVLNAIAAGEAQDAKDLQAILAAISQVDEATLAQFGLKRA